MPEFTSQEDVTQWLNTKPVDVARVFAARAALRSLPGLTAAFGLHGQSSPPLGELRIPEQASVALTTFRCLHFAWIFSAYPPLRLTTLARTADYIAAQSLVGIYHTEGSAAHAAGACNDDNAREFAATATNYAIEALSFSKQSFEGMLDACSVDAEMLDQRASPVTLANSQLWPGRVPDWFVDAWDELKQALLAEGEDWIVWTDWYEERLKGRHGDQAVEKDRAAIPDIMWERGPLPVNNRIREIFRAHGILRYDITNMPEITRQLSVLGVKELAIIGARVALRAVPLLEFKEHHFLLVLRAISSAWTAAATDCLRAISHTPTPYILIC